MLILPGCYGDLYQRVDDMNSKLDEIEQLCQEYNKNLSSLSGLIKALQSNDFITGMTKITEKGQEVGFTVDFLKHESITIRNGINGNIPTITSREDTEEKLGRWYWAVLLPGSSEYTWLTDNEGNKIMSTAIYPLVKKIGSYWYVSYELGATYSDEPIGKANGEDGDADIFHRVLVYSDYVVFSLKDGTNITLPLYSRYEALNDAIKTINNNVTSLNHMAVVLGNKWVNVESVEPIYLSGEIAGSRIIFSDESEIEIYNFVRGNVPQFSQHKGIDGLMYWYVTLNGVSQPLYTSEGNPVRAWAPETPVPEVTVKMDRNDDGFINYYWATVVGSDTTYVTDPEGNFIKAVSDSVKSTVFKDVDNTQRDYVVITLNDDSQVKIPKKNTIIFDADTISVFNVERSSVGYMIYGVGEEADISLITQGDITATITPGKSSNGTHSGQINIKPKYSFIYGEDAKIMMVVSAGSGSLNTVYKTMYVKAK